MVRSWFCWFLEKTKKERALKLKEILYSCFMLLNGAGIRGFAIRARGQDGQS